MKIVVLLFFAFRVSLPCNAQDMSVMIKGIHTIAEAWSFIKAHPKQHADVLSIKSVEDSSDFVRQICQAKRGTILKKGRFIYKVLWDTSCTFSRVNYIYLDGSILTTHQIDSLRNDIINQYYRGAVFSKLASIYTMDGNVTGDLPWFCQGSMAPEFVDAINRHSRDEVFKADVPSHNWFYVIKKTYDTRLGKEVVVLKVRR